MDLETCIAVNKTLEEIARTAIRLERERVIKLLRESTNVEVLALIDTILSAPCV